MNARRPENRLYTAVVLAFLAGLIALGLLGVSAALVAAIGAAVAAIGITLFHRSLEGRRERRRVPRRYVPSVLEGSSIRRRRGVHLGKRRHSAPPLRFR
ncbi:MAG: hypothetical protein QM729_11625 [Solirubrobacterales bacterium]